METLLLCLAISGAMTWGWGKGKAGAKAGWAAGRAAVNRTGQRRAAGLGNGPLRDAGWYPWAAGRLVRGLFNAGRGFGRGVRDGGQQGWQEGYRFARYATDTGQGARQAWEGYRERQRAANVDGDDRGPLGEDDLDPCGVCGVFWPTARLDGQNTCPMCAQQRTPSDREPAHAAAQRITRAAPRPDPQPMLDDPTADGTAASAAVDPRRLRVAAVRDAGWRGWVDQDGRPLTDADADQLHRAWSGRPDEPPVITTRRGAGFGTGGQRSTCTAAQALAVAERAAPFPDTGPADQPATPVRATAERIIPAPVLGPATKEGTTMTAPHQLARGSGAGENWGDTQADLDSLASTLATTRDHVSGLVDNLSAQGLGQSVLGQLMAAVEGVESAQASAANAATAHRTQHGAVAESVAAAGGPQETATNTSYYDGV